MSIRDILDEEMGHKVRQMMECSRDGFAMSVHHYATELSMMSEIDREVIYEMACDLRDIQRSVS
jgi:hypothetical protein